MAFALAIPVVVGAMGVSVDIARSYLVKERLSHALDAAALAGAGSANLEGDELQARVENFFYRNFGESGNIEIVIAQTSSNLSVSAVVPLDTTFMQVLGVSSVDISNNVVVQREVRGLEVVMVLDVTGSMATNDNIGALRTAATNFTHIICPGTTCVNNVRIGLVPFATTVNVGPYGLGRTPSNGVYDTAFVNNPHNLLFKQSGPGSSTAWWGCILERPTPQDTQDSETSWRWDMYRFVSISGSTTAPNTNCNKAYILPLTATKSTVLSRISGLTATGNTLSNVGMVWGYRVLSPEFPFREGVAFNDPKVRKVALLMTDGDNAIGSGYTAYGPWASLRLTDRDLDNKLAATCENMKEDGIIVYTITFTSGIDNTTKGYFRNCATDENKYFDAPTQAELVDTFQKIAAELSNLYIKD
jgi:Flp pilus assembly protein TadG